MNCYPKTFKWYNQHLMIQLKRSSFEEKTQLIYGNAKLF